MLNELQVIHHRSLEQHSFPYAPNWKHVDHVGKDLVADFIQLAHILFSDRDQLEASLSSWNANVLGSLAKVYRLSAYKSDFGVKYDAPFADACVNDDIIHLPRLEQADLVNHLQEEQFACEKEEFWALDSQEKVDEKTRWFATFLVELLEASIHEMYHVRQIIYAPYFMEETTRANKARFSEDSVWYGRDLGEHGATATTIVCLKRILTQLLSTPTSYEEAYSLVLIKHTLNMAIAKCEVYLREVSSQKYRTEYFAPRWRFKGVEQAKRTRV